MHRTHPRSGGHLVYFGVKAMMRFMQEILFPVALKKIAKHALFCKFERQDLKCLQINILGVHLKKGNDELHFANTGQMVSLGL
jgi:hypothetical protein